MLWAHFSPAGKGKLLRADGKMDGCKHGANLEENLLKAAKDLRMGRRFDLKHTARLKSC